MNSFDPHPENDGIDSLLTEFFQAEMSEEKLRELERTLPQRPRRTVPANPVLVKPYRTGGRSKSGRRSKTAWHRFRGSIGLFAAAAVCVVAFIAVQNSGTQVASDTRPNPESDAPQSAALVARLNDHPAPKPEERVTQSLPAASEAPVMAGIVPSGLSNLFSPPAVAPANDKPRRNLYDYRVSEETAPIVQNSNRTAKVEQRARVRTTNVSFFEPRTGSQVEMQLPEIEIEIVAAGQPTK